MVTTSSGRFYVTVVRARNSRACRRDTSISGPSRSCTCSRPPSPSFHLLDEIQVDDLAAVRAEEALRIQLLLERGERAAEQRPFLAPQQPHVVAFGGEQAHLAQRHEPAARPVPDEQLLQRRVAVGALRAAIAWIFRSAVASRSGSMGFSR